MLFADVCKVGCCNLWYISFMQIITQIICFKYLHYAIRECIFAMSKSILWLCDNFRLK